MVVGHCLMRELSTTNALELAAARLAARLAHSDKSQEPSCATLQSADLQHGACMAMAST